MIALLALALPAAHAGDAMHPDFLLRDAQGVDVLTTGLPYDPRQTCGGGCHDVAYIERMATHGADQLEVPDGTAMDCLVCHLESPDRDARADVLAQGTPALAATASLVSSGLVALDPTQPGGVRWVPEAFAEGHFPLDRLPLVPPPSETCGSCHGAVYRDAAPLAALTGHRGETTGTIFSGQRVDASALNLADKESLSRAWDVHAERLLECTSCHFSANHPAQRQEGRGRPAHLRFDPRTTPLDEYLHRPSHILAHGAEDAPMRRCDGCHDARVGHDFLPDPARHFAALACESCHIPMVPIGPRQQLDLTAVDAAGRPLEDWRGTDSTPEDPASLHAGYRPVLLPRATEGGAHLAPYHLSSRWAWVSTGQEVPVEKVAAAFLTNEAVTGLDADHDGRLSDAERRLDTAEKAEVIAARLRDLGVAEPTIVGHIEAWPISHGVVRGDTVTRECTDCHGPESRLDDELIVAAWRPGGLTPVPTEAAAALLDAGSVTIEPDGVHVRPPASRRYVFGSDRWEALDLLGISAVIGAVMFALGHGGLRYLTAGKSTEKHP